MRKTLSSVLSFLSKWAIKKHDMKIMVVTGRHGTNITGKLIAEMMVPDFAVRRALDVPFWDYSIPLSILGADDKRYSFWGWTGLIIRTTMRLLFGAGNSTWTILQMNSDVREICNYWLEIFDPSVTVVVNPAEGDLRFERSLVAKTKDFSIISRDFKVEKYGGVKKGSKLLIVGDEEGDDFRVIGVDHGGKGTKIKMVSNAKSKEKEEGVEFFAFQKGQFMEIPLTMAIATVLRLGIDADDVQDRLLRVQLDVEKFAKS